MVSRHGVKVWIFGLSLHVWFGGVRRRPASFWMPRLLPFQQVKYIKILGGQVARCFSHVIRLWLVLEVQDLIAEFFSMEQGLKQRVYITWTQQCYVCSVYEKFFCLQDGCTELRSEQVFPTFNKPHGSPAGRGICGVGTFSWRVVEIIDWFTCMAQWKYFNQVLKGPASRDRPKAASSSKPGGLASDFP